MGLLLILAPGDLGSCLFFFSYMVGRCLASQHPFGNRIYFTLSSGKGSLSL